MRQSCQCVQVEIFSVVCCLCVDACFRPSVARHTWHVRGSGIGLCEGLPHLAVSKSEVAVFEQMIQFNYVPGLKQNMTSPGPCPLETAVENPKTTESMYRA